MKKTMITMAILFAMIAAVFAGTAAPVYAQGLRAESFSIHDNDDYDDYDDLDDYYDRYDDDDDDDDDDDYYDDDD